MKILIVENDERLRVFLELLLSNWGHEVLSVTDGAEALFFFEDDTLDVIITEWAMPKVDGLELCRKLRSVTKVRQRYLYIILFTSNSGRNNVIKGMEAGADDYIIKPLDKTELQFRLNVAKRIIKIQREVTKLEGILPICSYCKKIREEPNSWEEIDKFISKHSSLNFSQSICPECVNFHL